MCTAGLASESVQYSECTVSVQCDCTGTRVRITNTPGQVTERAGPSQLITILTSWCPRTSLTPSSHWAPVNGQSHGWNWSGAK